MTSDELNGLLATHADSRVGTHWETCHLDGSPRAHGGCAVARLVAEVRRLRAANVALAERLAACSEVLGRAAERGKVCRCGTQEATACD